MAQDLNQDDIMDIISTSVERLARTTKNAKENKQDDLQNKGENKVDDKNISYGESNENNIEISQEKRNDIEDKITNYFNSSSERDEFEYKSSQFDEENNLVIHYDSIKDPGFTGKEFAYDFDNEEAKEMNIRTTEEKGLFKTENKTVKTISSEELSEYSSQEDAQEQIQEENQGLENQMLEEHQDDVNETIETEVKGDQSNNSYLSKQEVEDMLNDHLEQVQAIVNDPERKNDSIKHALKQSSNNLKSAMSNKVANKTQATKDSVRSVKNNAKMQVKNSISKVNQSIKNFSERIDNKLNLNQSQNNNSEQNEKTPKNAQEAKEQMVNSKFASEMETKLKSDNNLFKSALAVHSLKETEKYMEKTQNHLDNLSKIDPKDDLEQKQMNDLKNDLKQGYNNANEKYNGLKQNIDSDENIKSLANQVRQENEKQEQSEIEQEKEQSNEESKDKSKEKTLQK